MDRVDDWQCLYTYGVFNDMKILYVAAKACVCECIATGGRSSEKGGVRGWSLKDVKIIKESFITPEQYSWQRMRESTFIECVTKRPSKPTYIIMYIRPPGTAAVKRICAIHYNEDFRNLGFHFFFFFLRFANICVVFSIASKQNTIKRRTFD